MRRTDWIVIAIGLAALGVAVWGLVSGSGWTGFWFALIAAGLLARVPMRRYWQRVEQDDPAAVYLRVASMFALMALAGIGLAVAQLGGIGLRRDGFRGTLGVIAAVIGVRWSVRALRDHRRIRAAHDAAAND